MIKGRSTAQLARLAMAGLVLSAAGSGRICAQPVNRGRFPVERFRLAMDREGLLDVEWAAVPDRTSLDLTFWLGTADDPLVAYEEVNGEEQRLGALVSQRLAGTLTGAFVLRSGVQLGVELPVILSQSADAIAGVPGSQDLGGFGLGDVRVAPKLALGQRSGVHAAAIPAITLPTGSGEDYRGERSVSFAPELALSWRRGNVRAAWNLGYRARRNVKIGNLEVADEWLTRLGLGWRLVAPQGRRLELALSLSAATAATSPFGAANQNHLEALAGASIEASRSTHVIVAGGVGLNEGFGTPDWRVVAGVRLSKHPPPRTDSDGDGLFDFVDACASQAEDRDGFADEDGCPDSDNDRDGVADAVDAAPLEAEDRDGFADEDGAPDLDNDQDGIVDKRDACPLEAEAVNSFDDSDGCPDTIPDDDADGLNDREEQCPGQPEDADGHEDDDGCPDPDNDGDGLLDRSDRCALQPGPVDNHGCPDTDRDTDGLVDRIDNCPDEPGRADQQGCNTRQLVRIAGTRIELLDKVYFLGNQAAIQKRSHKLLRNVAAVLAAHPEIVKVRIEGHTDDRGDAQRNLELSRRRAQAVADFLAAEGVTPERLVATGHGETRPLAPNTTAQGRALNARIELHIMNEADDEVEAESRDGAVGP